MSGLGGLYSCELTPKGPMGPSPQRAPKAPLALAPPLGSHLIPLGSLGIPWAPPQGSRSSRGDNVASREIGGGAGIAGAYKQVGGYARSVDEFDEL